MKTIKETANSIYNYCVYAMDYDMVGLSFNESSLMSAIKEDREVISNYSENEFNTLKGYLLDKVRVLYEKNRNSSDTLEAEAKNDVVKNMSYKDALSEMAETEKFMQYLDEELTYNYFKKIVE